MIVQFLSHSSPAVMEPSQDLLDRFHESLNTTRAKNDSLVMCLEEADLELERQERSFPPQLESVFLRIRFGKLLSFLREINNWSSNCWIHLSKNSMDLCAAQLK